MRKETTFMLCLGLLAASCAVDETDSATVSACGSQCGDELEALHERRPQLIQPGEDQLLLAVTDDDYALYQEGQTVYATKLRRNAERTVVGQAPGTNQAFALQVGRVVFVWTNPDRTLPGFGVSPVILWTADDGPRLISSSSAVGVVATAASSDSRQIIYITNTTPDGLRGDIVHATTKNALSPTTLLRDIPLDFPFGQCRPLAGFGGTGAESFPVAAYCAGSDTTATLSKWVHGKKTDLISNIATPMPFTLESDPRGTTFFMFLADHTVATVTAAGHVSIVDDVLGKRGFVNRQGTAVYTTPTDAGLQLRIARHGRNPKVVSPLALLYTNTYNRGGYYKSRISSPDGSLAMYGASADPATGLLDVNLLDLSSGESTVLDSSHGSSPLSEIFTSDSRFALYLILRDLNQGIGSLFAGNAKGTHQIGTSNAVWDALRGEGSTVSFGQNPAFSPVLFELSTADLYVADAADPHASPRLVSPQANLFYLPSQDRRQLIFSSATEAEGPGLYIASGRP